MIFKSAQMRKLCKHLSQICATKLIFMITIKLISVEGLLQKEGCVIIITVFSRFGADYYKLVI